MSVVVFYLEDLDFFLIFWMPLFLTFPSRREARCKLPFPMIRESCLRMFFSSIFFCLRLFKFFVWYNQSIAVFAETKKPQGRGFYLLGVEGSFGNQVSLTYPWILENQELAEAKVKRIKALIEK